MEGSYPKNYKKVIFLEIVDASVSRSNVMNEYYCALKAQSNGRVSVTLRDFQKQKSSA